MRISDWSSDVCSSDLSRGTRAILRNRLPLIVAGLLAVVWLAGECGDRCGKGYAQQGIENPVFHDCSPLAIIVEWPQVRQGILIRAGRSNHASLTAGFDQTRRVGGTGSGEMSLPRRTGLVGQNARGGEAATPGHRAA